MMIDNVLRNREKEGEIIKVGMVGAGATGRAIALQLGTPAPGIRLVALANRTIKNGERALIEAGINEYVNVDNVQKAEDAIFRKKTVLTENPQVLTECSNIDVIVEVTGTVEFASNIVLSAIENGKNIILVNAELDSFLGPILKKKADQAGVVITNTDGDEPGVAMTLLRYLRTAGLKPVAAGNLKGMVDHYRTPETQRAFAEKYDQDVRKVTSFADSTKLSMEATVLANATGFQVGQRGMFGPKCDYVREIANLLPADKMLATGLIDYALGAAPYTGAFVIVHEKSSLKMAQLAYYKLGDGPFYVFYTPYHLPHIQIASSIGRAQLFKDPTVTPINGPACEVLTVAKSDLKAGTKLDGVGGFSAYGLIDNFLEARKANALPISFSDGCILKKDVKKDDIVTFDHVEMPKDLIINGLWNEQCEIWPYKEKK